MILKTTTNEFCFINVSFYETIADPRYFFEQDYEEMPEYEEELDFDFDSYCNKFIPFVQEWANKVGERLYEYGVNNIKVISVGHPKDHNYGTDWMDVRVEFCDEWRQKMLSNSGYDVTILLNMYLTLAFVKEFGFKAGEAWSEITEYAYGCLSYSDFATTEMLIPEGSEHLFKDIYTAKADELYHHVLDKFGWAWRDPKYKSETELCAMLKWAKEKGLTIEELSI